MNHYYPGYLYTFEHRDTTVVLSNKKYFTEEELRTLWDSIEENFGTKLDILRDDHGFKDIEITASIY